MPSNKPPEKPERDPWLWKWPTGWKSVHLPDDTPEDFKFEMELAELMSSFEERDPEGYAKYIRELTEKGAFREHDYPRDVFAHIPEQRRKEIAEILCACRS